MKYKYLWQLGMVASFVVAQLCYASVPVYAQEDEAVDNIGKIRQEIEDRNTKIQELEKEIARYKEDLKEVGETKQTLEKAVKTLDITRSKLATDIKVTENRIESTEFQILELSLEIVKMEKRLEQDYAAIAQSLRALNEIGSESLLEAILGENGLGSVWDTYEKYERFQTAIQNDVDEITKIKMELTDARADTEKKKGHLSGLRNELGGEKKVLDIIRNEQSTLLDDTKSTEANYQKLLAEKVTAREEFEQELNELEKELSFALDPSTIPPAGAGTLAWPFALDYMARCADFEKALGNIYCITQYFGNTKFSQTGAYNGNGHNGVDFRATQGTKVLSALAGEVIETGNTDSTRGCYSYGKWVLIRHANGLTTLYAHLSHIAVSGGQRVSTGDIIGYSGNTGYSTGPHLHFTVYATEAVKVVRLGDVKAFTNCANVRIPVSPLNAYLNPLSYL
jgi:murein DD-endopeptidase MepM/ murein hydrolase activator NlpD